MVLVEPGALGLDGRRVVLWVALCEELRPLGREFAGGDLVEGEARDDRMQAGTVSRSQDWSCVLESRKAAK